MAGKLLGGVEAEWATFKGWRLESRADFRGVLALCRAGDCDDSLLLSCCESLWPSDYALIAKCPRSVFLNRASFPLALISLYIVKEHLRGQSERREGLANAVWKARTDAGNNARLRAAHSKLQSLKGLAFRTKPSLVLETIPQTALA